MEDELDRSAYAGTELSQPTEPGPTFVTGVNEEIGILEAAHPGNFVKLPRSPLRKELVGLGSQLQRLRQR